MTRRISAPLQTVGTVYLLHLDRPFGHARHYLGWASDLAGRLDHHAAGRGANMLKHAAAAGVSWRLARIWPDRTRGDERRMHVNGHARRCPVCRPSLAGRSGVAAG